MLDLIDLLLDLAFIGYIYYSYTNNQRVHSRLDDIERVVYNAHYDIKEEANGLANYNKLRY